MTKPTTRLPDWIAKPGPTEWVAFGALVVAGSIATNILLPRKPKSLETTAYMLMGSGISFAIAYGLARATCAGTTAGLCAMVGR